MADSIPYMATTDDVCRWLCKQNQFNIIKSLLTFLKAHSRGAKRRENRAGEAPPVALDLLVNLRNVLCLSQFASRRALKYLLC